MEALEGCDDGMEALEECVDSCFAAAGLMAVSSSSGPESLSLPLDESDEFDESDRGNGRPRLSTSTPPPIDTPPPPVAASILLGLDLADLSEHAGLDLLL